MENKALHNEDLIRNLIDRINAVPFRDKVRLDEFKEHADRIFETIFGESSEYRPRLKNLHFAPRSFYSTAADYQESWEQGRVTAIKIIDEILHDPLLNNGGNQNISGESNEKTPFTGIPKNASYSEGKEPLPFDAGAFVAGERQDLLTDAGSQNAPPAEQQDRGALYSPSAQEHYDAIEEETLEEMALNWDQQANAQIIAPRKPEESVIQRIDEFKQSLNHLGTFVEKENIQPGVYKPSVKKTDQIFVVHGFDTELLDFMTVIFQKLGFGFIISHEHGHQEKTMFQKFLDHPEIGFAAVALSPDDIGYRKDQYTDKARFRARQNVVFEMGFLIGKLGRNRVFVLVRDEYNFELPTNYFDAIYTPFDRMGHWQTDLIKQLKNCDFKVDSNKLL